MDKMMNTRRLYAACNSYKSGKVPPFQAVKLTDVNGSPVFSATYDAWGKQTVNLNTFKFHRGYTGHEHLPEFDLINMNGRVYSPTLGRFMSADPFVQMPDNSQSYNRYSYCLNNPMVYSDPSGYKWKWWQIALGIGALLDPISAVTSASVVASTTSVTAGAMAITTLSTASIIMGSSIVTTYANAIASVPVAAISGAFSHDAKQRVKNVWTIANGIFQTDANIDFADRVWQLYSRFTWEQPFTSAGILFQNFVNYISSSNVGYFHGATVMQSSLFGDKNGVTLGSSITISRKGSIGYGNFKLLHEYGHYLQLRQWGPGPYLTGAMQSLFTAKNDEHRKFWVEMDANARTLHYLTGMAEHQAWEFANSSGIKESIEYREGMFALAYIIPFFNCFIK